ncbi:hypothetical protein BDR26DRAFT_849563, partial [Obelidium mucronatum]
MTEELARWGPPNSAVRRIVMQYWLNTRMVKHWLSLRSKRPRDYLCYLQKGYCEPISSRTVTSRALTTKAMFNISHFQNASEERLYYVLNNMERPNHVVGTLKPVNKYNRGEYLRRGQTRSALANPLDDSIVAKYCSRADTFLTSPNITRRFYSPQIPHKGHPNRAQALLELASGINMGNEHLETMIMIDMSESMSVDPTKGVHGKDGITRYHDQPPTLAVVKNLVHRFLKHMVPRTQRQYPDQDGIPLVAFSGRAEFCGSISPNRFQNDWRTKIGCHTYSVRRKDDFLQHEYPFYKITKGDKSRVMEGWQVVKSIFFEQMYLKGHGLFDRVFGWQPTPGMPKLSLLVFLDGESEDIDEFELELMGQTWAYVTIVLVGYEDCPNHHSNAVEFERVAEFNPHVGFYDFQGRVLERYLVEEVLQSVYPVDPPFYDEIISPQFDL